MPEFDELRLKITLDDQASAGLARLRGEIEALGGGGNNFDRIRNSTRELTALMRPLASGTLGARQAMNLLSMQFGGTAVAAGALTYAFINQMNSLKEFSDQITQMGIKAKVVGAEGGEFAHVVKQLEGMGIANPQAQQFVTTYVQKIGELSKANSDLRMQLLNMAGDNALDMRDWISRQVGFANDKDLASGINEFIRGRINIINAELDDPQNKGAVQAAAEFNRVAKVWGLDTQTLVQIDRNLTTSTLEQRAKWNSTRATAEAFADSYRQLSNRWDEFNKGMMSSVSGTLASFAKGFDASGVDVNRWGVIVGDVMGRAAVNMADFVDKVVRLIEWIEKFSNKPNVAGAQQDLSKLVNQSGNGNNITVPALQTGGIVTEPTLAMIGEAGPEAVIPLGEHTSGGIGQALYWGGWAAAQGAAMVGVPGAQAIASTIVGLGRAERAASHGIATGGFEGTVTAAALLAAGPLGAPLKMTMTAEPWKKRREAGYTFNPETGSYERLPSVSRAEAGEWIKSMLPSFLQRQFGGPVNARQRYVVGETNAEVFFPGVSELELRRDIYSKHDNTWALGATERPATNLRDELRTLNEWFRTGKGKRAVGATDPGSGPPSVGSGGGDGGGWPGDRSGELPNAAPGGPPPVSYADITTPGILPPGTLPPSVPQGVAIVAPPGEEPIVGLSMGQRMPAVDFWEAPGGAGVTFPPGPGREPPGESGAPPGGLGGGGGLGNLTPNVFDPSNKRIPASIRNANVGASWPTSHDWKYGGKVGVLYDPKNKIGQFSTVEGGIGSNIELLLTSKHYRGKTLAEAVYIWSGKNRRTVFGDSRDHTLRITPELMADPEFRRTFFHIKAKAEAGKKSWITDAQIDTGYEIYKAGGLEKWRANRATPDQAQFADRAAPNTGGTPSQLPSSQPSTTGARGTGFRRGSEGTYVPEGYQGDSIKKRMGKMRPFEVNPDLAAILEYSAEKAGAVAVITSGAQESVDAAYKRGGGKYRPSERHTYRPGMNKLGAADVQFQVPDGKGGMRTLDPNVASDQPILAKIIRQSAALGASGMGAQYGNMGSSVHIGGKGRPRDKVGVYAGGAWIRQAWDEGWQEYLAGPPKEGTKSVAQAVSANDNMKAKDTKEKEDKAREQAKDQARIASDSAEVDAAMSKEANVNAEITIKTKVTAPGGTTVVAKNDGAIKKTEIEREKSSETKTESSSSSSGAEKSSEQKEAA